MGRKRLDWMLDTIAERIKETRDSTLSIRKNWLTANDVIVNRTEK
jgi:hypothetical protein